ncbi:MAG: hypothetical protein AB3N07_00340 [Ruegeria sp.]
MIRNVIAALAVTIGCFGATSVQANSDLQSAVDLWLQGDDRQSLQMLADLAAEGDANARLLLARIETADLGPSPYRQSLDRSAARDLFRYKDFSPFGRSWLFVEAQQGNELAQALMQAKSAEPDLELIDRLNKFGEHQATDRPTRIVALYGDQDLRDELAADEAVMQDLLPYLAYLSGTSEHRGDGVAALRHIQPNPVDTAQPDTLGMAGLLALGLGYGDVSPDNRWRTDVEDWLMSAPSTKPVADLCATQCSGQARACAFAFLAVSGGYFEVIRYDSPLETVIPQDQFLNSPRARLMVLRRAVLARTETNQNWLSDSPQLAQISSCAADLIQSERSKYR